MNGYTYKGDWGKKKEKLKQLYAELTDDDLIYTEGKAYELTERIQKRLNISREYAIDVIRSAQ